jgi:hypothetical protein
MFRTKLLLFMMGCEACQELQLHASKQKRCSMASTPQTSLSHFVFLFWDQAAYECCIHVVASLDRCKRYVHPQLSFLNKNICKGIVRNPGIGIIGISLSLSHQLFIRLVMCLYKRVWTIRLVFLRRRHVKTRGDPSPLLVKLVN